MSSKPELLSDEALGEIEARLRLARNPPGPTKARCTDSCGSSDARSTRHTYNSECRFGAQSAVLAEFDEHAKDDMDALCQTVRALRAQLQTKATLVISDIAKENNALREQLAQVEKERDQAREDLRILTQGRFIQS